ncbi:hypothetical protein BV408_29840, partial [Klebsiella pneumoniae]
MLFVLGVVLFVFVVGLVVVVVVVVLGFVGGGLWGFLVLGWFVGVFLVVVVGGECGFGGRGS